MKKTVDLRSDTVTLPNAEMLNTISQAVLGDDILGEDPTVRQLEETAAALLGKEDALLVISGTMANQIAVMALTDRGQEVILGKQSHLYNLEVAGLSTLSQVQVRAIDVIDGYYNPEDIEKAIVPKNIYDIQRAETGLICLENTYNLNEGRVVTLENMKKIKDVANSHNIPIYLDGARLFNASVAMNIDAADICEYVDAVQFCLTKGLGCPLGSILAGSKEFILKARKIRQRLGGGMRQAGIIAAPGIYALQHMLVRLKEDHKHAFSMAESLSSINGLKLDSSMVQTNIISPEIVNEEMNADKLIQKLKEDYQINVKKVNERTFRIVIHCGVTKEDIEYVIKAFKEIFS